MNIIKQLTKEFKHEEKRYQRAKKHADKHYSIADAWLCVMKDAVNEQHKINDKLKELKEKLT